MKRTLLALLSSLCITCSAADITLKDGRVLQGATIVGQDAASVTIRHSSGIVKADKNILPDQIAALFPAAVSASPMPTPETRPPAAPAIPSGDDVYVDGIQLRALKQVAKHTYYSWVARAGNPTPHTAKVRADITLYDADGFKIGSAIGDPKLVRPGTFSTLSGDSIIETEMWDQIARYEVTLKVE